MSPELLLALDLQAAEPQRSQLERQVREAIRSGRLAVGERLPSSRELARELGLSRGLVRALSTALGEVSISAGRTQSFPGAQYRRLTKRMPKRKP